MSSWQRSEASKPSALSTGALNIMTLGSVHAPANMVARESGVR